MVERVLSQHIRASQLYVWIEGRCQLVPGAPGSEEKAKILAK